jgi:hypothetical protein
MAYVETSSGAQFSAAQAISATANATNLFDVTGAGTGNAPAMTGTAGLNTNMFVDIGAGDGEAVPQVVITNALTTAGTGTGTITFSLQSAPDNGSYSPGTYTTIFTSPAFVGTAITAPFQYIFNVPQTPPGIALPRFYRLAYTVSGTAAATFNANLLLNAPTVRDVTKYGNNLNF